MNASLSFIRTSERPFPVANVVVLGKADTAAKRPRLSLFLIRISACLPSPADGCVEGTLSPDGHFVPRPEAPFFLRVQGDSMA